MQYPATLCRRLQVVPKLTPCASVALFTGQHPFTNRLINALGEKVSRSVEELTRQAVLADDRMVTESRRKLERFSSAPETLAERLASQKAVRRFLIPSDIRVDKSRMYMEFTWPEEAAAAAAALEKAECEFRAKRDAAEGKPQAIVSAPLHATCDAKSPGKSSMRTRGLAEYLRVYTTSTDGQYGMPKYPIYGRRGLTITDVYPVGNYAVRISFSDGHSGGIYSYEYLYFLTSPGNKYGLMRAYLADLRRHKKSRDPPKRAPSKRRRILQDNRKPQVNAEDDLGVGRKSENDDGGEGGHLAPSFPRND